MTNEENQDIELEEEVEEEVEDQEEEVVEDEEVEEDEEKDWKSEALKYKAIANRKKKKLTNKLETKAKNPDVGDRIANLELAEKKRQFGYDNGLSPQETDKIFQLNQDPDKEVLNDPFVKAGLKALRAKDRLDDNSPTISAKANTLSNKKFVKLTKNEKQAEFTKFMKQKGVIE